MSLLGPFFIPHLEMMTDSLLGLDTVTHYSISQD